MPAVPPRCAVRRSCSSRRRAARRLRLRSTTPRTASRTGRWARPSRNRGRPRNSCARRGRGRSRRRCRRSSRTAARPSRRRRRQACRAAPRCAVPSARAPSRHLSRRPALRRSSPRCRSIHAASRVPWPEPVRMKNSSTPRRVIVRSALEAAAPIQHRGVHHAAHGHVDVVGAKPLQHRERIAALAARTWRTTSGRRRRRPRGRRAVPRAHKAASRACRAWAAARSRSAGENSSRAPSSSWCRKPRPFAARRSNSGERRSGRTVLSSSRGQRIA